MVELRGQVGGVRPVFETKERGMGAETQLGQWSVGLNLKWAFIPKTGDKGPFYVNARSLSAGFHTLPLVFGLLPVTV